MGNNTQATDPQETTGYSIGADIGGSHITSAVYDHSNQRLIKETLVSVKVDTTGSREEVIGGWGDALSETMKLFGQEVSGVGLAMPGPFDYYNGITRKHEADKFDSIFNVNLRLEFAEKLRLSPSQIRFINDASAFSIAEALRGEASAYSRVTAITLGTGLGASFLIDGRPIIRDKRVPEGGFLYNQYYENILADDLFSTRGIVDAYRKKTGADIGNVRALYERAATESAARVVLEEFGARLGDFIGPYLDDFGAEVLVLGGNISRAFTYFETTLQERLKGLSKIYVSGFGEEAAMIGSALLLNESYYNEIKETLKLM